MCIFSFKHFFLLVEAKFRSSSKQSAIGWISNKGQWIPLDTSNEEEPDLHEHPKYISQLEPELEKQFQEKHPGYQYQYDDPEREELKEECIARGHIRVAEMVGMREITIQAKDKYSLNFAIKKLEELFPNKINKFSVLADIISPAGNIKSFEWNPEERKWLVFRGHDFF